MPTPYPWISDEHAAQFKDELFIDCAVYGKRNSEPGVDYSQVLEEKTYELGGIKTLISRNHYTASASGRSTTSPTIRLRKRASIRKGIFPAALRQVPPLIWRKLTPDWREALLAGLVRTRNRKGKSSSLSWFCCWASC